MTHKAYSRPGKERGSTPLGDRLKQERLRRGFGLSEFARMIGISEFSITAIENRGAIPRLDTAVALAQVLDCSLDWLSGIES